MPLRHVSVDELVVLEEVARVFVALSPLDHERWRHEWQPCCGARLTLQVSQLRMVQVNVQDDPFLRGGIERLVPASRQPATN